ncbi:Rieske (2Fe-2S) protein [Acidithrix ferrooxidans]
MVAHNDEFSCFENACSHMELPLDRASVDADGVLACPWHGF